MNKVLRRVLIGLILGSAILLGPVIALAQQEVMITGQRADGVTQIYQADSRGRVITSRNLDESDVPTLGCNQTHVDSTTRGGGCSQSTLLPPQPAGCTTAGGGPCTNFGGSSPTSWSSTDFSQWPNLTVTVTVVSGTLTDALVEWSADNSNWEVWDSTTFDNMTGTKSIAISGNSRRYLRLEGRAAGVTQVTVVVSANAN